MIIKKIKMCRIGHSSALCGRIVACFLTRPVTIAGLDINGCPLARGNQKSYLGKLRLISGCPNGQVDFGWMLI